MRPLHPALVAAAALAFALPAMAQNEAPAPALSPSDIVNAAPQEDWVVIPPEDLLVMTLAPDAEGKPRQVVIQLMPAPLSQGWVHNIRLLARSGWYDGTSVNRVQDNYVTQWGDPNYDNPEATGTPKRLPQGLKVMGEAEYSASYGDELSAHLSLPLMRGTPGKISGWTVYSPSDAKGDDVARNLRTSAGEDPYARFNLHYSGWPVASADMTSFWPVHCYGMVGVGRNLSPDTGSGAELYTVIGHAPRHLDRNIALVGRVIEGMQHLSSLPRGSGALGFYSKEEAEKRTPILSVRVASDLPEAEQPQFEYLSTETETFARYVEARANRRDEFFITPAGGADICNIPVPVRRFEYVEE